LILPIEEEPKDQQEWGDWRSSFIANYAEWISVRGIGIVGYTKLPLTATDRWHMVL